MMGPLSGGESFFEPRGHRWEIHKQTESASLSCFKGSDGR